MIQDGHIVYPEAYWSCERGELVAYNSEFARLLQVPEEVLRGGFLWTDVGVPNNELRHCISQVVRQEHAKLLSGLKSSTQFNLTWEQGSERIRVQVIATMICTEVRWVCVAQSEADELITHLRGSLTKPTARKFTNRNATPYDHSIHCWSWRQQRKIRKGTSV